MTEKDYSGTATAKIGKGAKSSSKTINKVDMQVKSKKEIINPLDFDNKGLSQEEIKDYNKAGEIGQEVRKYAKTIIKKGVKIREIADKIEAKILELGGELAFPVNISINDIAAHYAPSYNEETLAEGIIKIDLGAHINGCVCDTAFSLDLTEDKKYSHIIKATDEALKNALELIKKNKAQTKINEIGRVIHDTIIKSGLAPIRNLSGHSLSKYEIHAGITIPNYDNGNDKEIGDGAFAVEPFATDGAGVVYDGSNSNDFRITKDGNVRDSFARQVLSWLIENKKTLPFSQREIVKKFGSRALFALRSLEQAGIIEEYACLVEQNHGAVSQSETSFLIHDNQVEIICEV